VTQLSESVGKSANNPMYRFHLGMAYLAAGEFDSAKRSLLEALKEDPGFPYAANARAALDRIAARPH